MAKLSKRPIKNPNKNAKHIHTQYVQIHTQYVQIHTCADPHTIRADPHTICAGRSFDTISSPFKATFTLLNKIE